MNAVTAPARQRRNHSGYAENRLVLRRREARIRAAGRAVVESARSEAERTGTDGLPAEDAAAGSVADFVLQGASKTAVSAVTVLVGTQDVAMLVTLALTERRPYR